ncbi:MAG: thiamine phosphate synthase [Clostridia bacterium]|nr:thiamine phosphate synthase [Clostridia bacterium]
MKNGLYLPGDTDLYCITAEEYSNGRSNIEVVSDIIESGVKIIQYREKDKSLREKYEECKIIRQMTKKAGVTFIVNDHVDLAMIVAADGVHIGQDDLPLGEVRKLVGDKIIGISTHSPDQAQKAAYDGADYIGVGPIFPTKTKKNVCDAVGLEYLDYVVENMSIPFVAIGGIKEHNVEDVILRGAGCVAMVTEIVGAKDIPGLIHSIRLKMGTAQW